MKFIPVKTRAMLPPKNDVFKVLDEFLPKLREGDVVFIASKILGIHQGRCIKIGRVDKSKLIRQEADYSLPKSKVNGSDIVLTIKNHILIPSAGIDESNADGYFVLWPKNVNRLLKQIVLYLRKKHKIKNLAAVATDSHTTPLRWGTSGVAIGFFGLDPLRDYRGKKDIFGRKLKYTQANIVDALSSMAVLLMGEGNERTPIVIFRDADFVRFTAKDTYKKFVINPKQDLYYPLLKQFKNIKIKK